jgi:predicted enzyme related to lactoylglutathione lyase
MPNPLVHWELMVSDVERARTFYKQVFDWSFTAAGPEYTLIQTGAEPGGGLMKRPPHVTMSTLNSYFRVDDLDRTLRNAVEAGARVIVPRMEVPTVGWFAMFLDPDEIPIGVMQLRS